MAIKLDVTKFIISGKEYTITYGNMEGFTYFDVTTEGFRNNAPINKNVFACSSMYIKGEGRRISDMIEKIYLNDCHKEDNLRLPIIKMKVIEFLQLKLKIKEALK